MPFFYAGAGMTGRGLHLCSLTISSPNVYGFSAWRIPHHICFSRKDIVIIDTISNFLATIVTGVGKLITKFVDAVATALNGK